MIFKYALDQDVVIRVSGEIGYVKSRSESISHTNQYLIHYRAGDGRAAESWFDESDIYLYRQEDSGTPMIDETM